LVLVVLLLGARLAPAAGSVLELIPEDATAALGISSIDELRKKGDRFFAAAEIKNLGRPSQFFEMVYDALGIHKGLDRGGSAAIVVANPQVVGIQLWDAEGHLNLNVRLIDLFVGVVPFSDRDAFAENFGIKKGDLKPDTLVASKGKNFGQFFYAHGNHVFFGNHAKAVLSVAQGKRAGADLTPARRRGLERADILLHLNARELGPLVKDMRQEIEKNLLKHARDKEDKVVRQLMATLAAVETTWIGVRVEEGLAVSWVNTFPRTGAEAARKFLTELQGGSGTADLAGLPEDRVLLAQALRGDGSQNAPLMRALYGWLLQNTVQTKGLLATADLDSYLGVFGEIWKHLRGNRFALYTSADRLKHGLCSAVAILDVENSEKFLTELRQLAGFAAMAEEPAAPGKDSQPALQSLIDNLASERYAARESAAVRLRLVGEPALPFLEKAIASEDPEVRRRASQIKERIVAVTVQRRKELLAAPALRPVHVLFGFAKPENLDGQRIDVVRIKMSEKGAADKLRELLGPDGDRVRLAVHGKQVVVLLGSDQEMLRTVLKNLKEGKRGLADAKELAAAREHLNAARSLGLHVSLAAAQALWTAADLSRPGDLPTSLTSFALTASPEFLQFDVWVPAAEFKFIQRALVGF